MVRVAAVQAQPILMDIDANLQLAVELLREAAQRGASLVVFPEAMLTGYSLTAEEAGRLAEPIPGRQTERLIRACAETGSRVVVGTLERDVEGTCYNTAVLLDGGGVLGRYRKTHLPFLGMDRYLAAGDEFTGPIETPVGRIGMLICYDLRFPEPTRVLALQGAQIVTLSTCWPTAATLYPDHMARTRAAENHIYLVAADRIGEERGTRYLGRSQIVSPLGEVLAQASSDQQEILLADIDPAQSDAKRRVFVPGEYELDPFGDRRPELYRPIASDDPLAE